MVKTEKNRIQPGSGAAIELARTGMSFDSLGQISEWVESMANLSGKMKSQAHIDALYQLFAGKENPWNEFGLLKYCRDEPETIVFAPIFENFISKTGNEFFRGTGINAYYGIDNPSQVHMWLCRISRRYIDAVGNADKAFAMASDSARIMAGRDAASLLLNKLYDLKDKFDKRFFENDETRKDLLCRLIAQDVMNGSAPPPFRESITSVSRDLKHSIQANMKEFDEKMRASFSAFSANECASRAERENAVSMAFRFISAYSGSLKCAGAVKDIGYQTFVDKAAEISAEIGKRAEIAPKKAQIAARLASGKSDGIDFRWLDLVSLDSKNPFDYNLSENESQASKIFGLACRMAKDSIGAGVVCDRAAEFIAGDPALSRIGLGKPGLPESVFCMISKGMMSGFTYQKEDEGWEAWQKITEDARSGGARSFVRPSA